MGFLICCWLVWSVFDASMFLNSFFDFSLLYIIETVVFPLKQYLNRQKSNALSGLNPPKPRHILTPRDSSGNTTGWRVPRNNLWNNRDECFVHNVKLQCQSIQTFIPFQSLSIAKVCSWLTTSKSKAWTECRWSWKQVHATQLVRHFTQAGSMFAEASKHFSQWWQENLPLSLFVTDLHLHASTAPTIQGIFGFWYSRRLPAFVWISSLWHRNHTAPAHCDAFVLIKQLDSPCPIQQTKSNK